jgi:hypothetical protein
MASHSSNARYERAVVIGASMAGLAVARVGRLANTAVTARTIQPRRGQKSPSRDSWSPQDSRVGQAQ